MINDEKKSKNCIDKGFCPIYMQSHWDNRLQTQGLQIKPTDCPEIPANQNGDPLCVRDMSKTLLCFSIHFQMNDESEEVYSLSNSTHYLQMDPQKCIYVSSVWEMKELNLSLKGYRACIYLCVGCVGAYNLLCSQYLSVPNI